MKSPRYRFAALKTNRLRAQGRTLIELIIAIAISLVIVAGVSSLYLSSSGVSRLAGEVGSAEESGQIAMFAIGNAIRLGGYGEIFGTTFIPRDNTLFDGAHIRGCTDSRFADPLPVPPIPPNFDCTALGVQDALYVRYQARHQIAIMPEPEKDLVAMRDCLGDNATTETIDVSSGTSAAGEARQMVTSVFGLVLNASGRLSLNCIGNGGGGNQPLVEDVVEFKVFYRFDEETYLTGQSNATPLGGAIRDATYINALPAFVDPWDYVVSVIVCLTVRSNEDGVSTNIPPNSTPRCPANAAEASTGLALTGPNPATGELRRAYNQVFTVRSRATQGPSFGI